MVEQKLSGAIKYEEFGRNYRFFLNWRYAAVLAIGALDFWAFELAKQGEIHWPIRIFLTLIIIFISLYELRTVDIYRNNIFPAAKRMEVDEEYDGYFTVIERQGENRGGSWQEWWKGVCGKIMEDFFKPTHTFIIMSFAILSILFILFTGIVTPRNNKKDVTLEKIEAHILQVDNKVDSIINDLSGPPETQPNK